MYHQSLSKNKVCFSQNTISKQSFSRARWLRQYIFFTQEADVKRIVVVFGHEIQGLSQIASNSSYVLRVSGYVGLFNKLEDIIKLACSHQQHPGKFVKLERNLMRPAGVNCSLPHFQIKVLARPSETSLSAVWPVFESKSCLRTFLWGP